jgi:hypothetical protein
MNSSGAGRRDWVSFARNGLCPRNGQRRHFQILGFTLLDGDGSAVDAHEDPQFWQPAKLGNVPSELHGSLAVRTLRPSFVGFHTRRLRFCGSVQRKEAPAFSTGAQLGPIMAGTQ